MSPSAADQPGLNAHRGPLWRTDDRGRLVLDLVPLPRCQIEESVYRSATEACTAAAEHLYYSTMTRVVLGLCCDRHAFPLQDTLTSLLAELRKAGLIDGSREPYARADVRCACCKLPLPTDHYRGPMCMTCLAQRTRDTQTAALTALAGQLTELNRHLTQTASDRARCAAEKAPYLAALVAGLARLDQTVATLRETTMARIPPREDLEEELDDTPTATSRRGRAPSREDPNGAPRHGRVASFLRETAESLHLSDVAVRTGASQLVKTVKKPIVDRLIGRLRNKQVASELRRLSETTEGKAALFLLIGAVLPYVPIGKEETRAALAKECVVRGLADLADLLADLFFEPLRDAMSALGDVTRIVESSQGIAEGAQKPEDRGPF